MICESCGVRMAGTPKGMARTPVLCCCCETDAKALLRRNVAEVEYHARLWNRDATKAYGEIAMAKATGFPGPDPEWEEDASQRLADAMRPLTDCRAWLARAKLVLEEKP